MSRKIVAFFILANLAGGQLAGQNQESPEERKKTVVYEVKWRETLGIASLVNEFIEGRAKVGHNTFTVTATDREHAMIEGLLKKYDVRPRDFQLQCYLLKASTNGGEGLHNGVPEFVRKVVREVASLTRYNHFELIDAPILRISDGRRASISGETPIGYTVAVGQNQVVEEGDVFRLRIDRFSIQFRILAGYRVGNVVADAETVEKELEKTSPKPLVEPIYRSGGIDTSFNIADGETIVLGASRMASVSKSEEPVDFAVVTVVTATLLP